jgi:hypothetical protein
MSLESWLKAREEGFANLLEKSYKVTVHGIASEFGLAAYDTMLKRVWRRSQG